MLRKAKLTDAKDIQKLSKLFAERGEMLPRSLIQIYENIRDFVVAVKDNTLIGVCALHVTWENLAEVRTLAVLEEYHRTGIGKMLVESCLQEARDLEIQHVFALTYKPEFFKKQGFSIIDKNELPHKVWQDCLNCPKFPDCDEIAMRIDL